MEAVPGPHPDSYWEGLTPETLIELCHDGSRRACEELDRRGIEPDMLDVDGATDTSEDAFGDALEAERHARSQPSALETRARQSERAAALAAIGGLAVGKTIIGLEVDAAGCARLMLEGGLRIAMYRDGTVELEESLRSGPPATLAVIGRGDRS